MTTAAARRERLDVVLVARGFLPTRAKAQAAILAGEVYVGGARVTKPGLAVAPDAPIEIRPLRPAYVSRGGLKLDHALTVFGIDPAGWRVADVGASTGGFTDCLLRRGARQVYAIDVGAGQLHWSLRTDPRVVVLERRDVRTVDAALLDGPVDLATVDVSFISLGKVLPAVRRLVRPGGAVVALVKPQFEAGPKAARGGVVRDAAVHRHVLARVARQAEESGYTVAGATYSPIAGPDGNLEFFLHLRTEHPPDVQGGAGRVDLDAVVDTAHAVVPRRGVRR
ncbi:MAG: TlyA family RNA methyltransferase [Armatimonadota bacterium]|nr:TlyA family RNA methyltransferase [Armatimonadota bacterium]MDR7450383.1 TlyA family RNA methyltransferase [Armatimonadota bacterium]MDR7467034.1 TlyA family RNA methyltransferase [Armatimonadota bacterium]MDR7493424.1 TlyA family RNA methyltransferase [Armatimonadota bacterium]MDR7498689.1 TlyA family RNA methyltransferase [Armatimonadota bacterium]